MCEGRARFYVSKSLGTVAVCTDGETQAGTNVFSAMHALNRACGRKHRKAYDAQREEAKCERRMYDEALQRHTQTRVTPTTVANQCVTYKLRSNWR